MTANSPYLSDELFHLVGRACPDAHEHNFQILAKVLLDGCVSHPPHENNWGKVQYVTTFSEEIPFEDLLVPTITCYCDIPLGALGTHVAKYGAFGLSFPRQLLIQYRARPVIYIPVQLGQFHDWGDHALRSIRAALLGLHAHLIPEIPKLESVSRTPTKVPQTREEAIRQLDSTLGLEVLAYIKPYNADLAQTHPDYFYAEREWRKLGNVKFEVDDVSQVVVHRDFLDRAKSQFPEYRDRIVAAPPPSSRVS